MNAASRKTVAAAAIAVGIAQGAVWIVLCAALIRLVPRFEKVFVEFNVELPDITKLLIVLSRVLAGYWFIALAVILAWPFVNWGVVSLLSPSPEVAFPRRLWYVLTWLAPMLFAAFTVVALFLPLSRLTAALSG